uniref:Clade I nitrous oxide reductase n=1 Tax=Macrostomum lignano TaxID=282301 RepID=A0A1I8GXF2_9PLAT
SAPMVGWRRCTAAGTRWKTESPGPVPASSAPNTPGAASAAACWTPRLPWNAALSRLRVPEATPATSVIFTRVSSVTPATTSGSGVTALSLRLAPSKWAGPRPTVRRWTLSPEPWWTSPAACS